MAGKRSDEHELEILTNGWVAVNQMADSLEWKAWRDYRRFVLHAYAEPQNFTVPTPFPPSTEMAAKTYVVALKAIRRMIGWNDRRAQLPNDPAPWR